MMAASEATIAAPSDEPGLGRRVFTAAKWSLSSTAAIKLLGVAVSIVLARTLGPEAFGVVAVATVAQTAMLSLNELGVSVALVRWQGDDRKVAPTVATLSTLGGLVCFIGLFLAAPYAAAAMGAPQAALPIQIMSVGVLIDGLVATPAALLQRHFMQGKRAAADLSNFGVGSAVSVVLALFGLGALAIAIGRVAGSAVSAILLFPLSPQPFRFGWSREVLGPLLRVGIPLAGASLVVFGILNLDYIVVGRTIGPVGLGFYVLAFGLSSWPVTLLSGPIRSVALPAFSRLVADPTRLSAVVVSGFGALLSVTVPIAATLGSLAQPLVHVVYGKEWLAAAVVLSWLAALGACRVALEFFYDLLVALGASKRLFLLQLTWLVALAVALPLGGLWFGIGGVAAAHTAVAVLLVIPLHLALVRHRLSLSAVALLRQTVAPLASGAVVVAVSLACQAVLPPWPTLVIAGGVGGLLTLRAGLRLRSALMGSSVPAAGPATAATTAEG